MPVLRSLTPVRQDDSHFARKIDTTFRRVESVEIEDVPGQLPQATIQESTDLHAVADTALARLSDFDNDVLSNDILWRDIFALTGTLRTFSGKTSVLAAWSDLQSVHAPHNFTLKPGSARLQGTDAEHQWILADFTFETCGDEGLKCSGSIGVVPGKESGWRIWLLCTVLEEVKGLGSPDHLSYTAVDTQQQPNGNNPNLGSADYECVVVGSGFGGLCVAGRLKALGVRYLVIDKQSKVGDNWLDRYDSARFHTSKWYSEMPVQRVFDETYDYFLSAAELAKGYQAYVDKMNINISLSTQLDSAEFDEDAGRWNVHVTRNGASETLTTAHVVLAIGAGSGQIPKMPNLPGRDIFQGVVLHSKEYKNAKAWHGLQGVVVGAANTAHDVAEDMVDAGMSKVTMIQRGATPVFPIESYKKWADPIYNAVDSIEDADRLQMVPPIGVTRLTTIYKMKQEASNEEDRFAALERAGFKLDRSLDLWKCVTKRNGGHYMDVGGSKKIGAGLIKMKSDAALEGYTKDGLYFSDGSHVQADVVVFCTGFSNEYRNEALKIVGPKIGKLMDDYWLLDKEGELRGAYKKQGYPGIWYHGGGVMHSRFYSRFVALQIKADVAGRPLKIYKGASARPEELRSY